MNDVTIITPKQISLLGDENNIVARMMPRRDLDMVGAFCFLDYMAPGSTTLRVPPHPHTCLQTLTWLFDGEVTHRDSLGSNATIGSGEASLMTAGKGISHTEYSSSPDLHGIQLWVALPDEARMMDPQYETFAAEPVRFDDHEVAVFVGELGLADSPVEVFSPLVAAEIRLTTSEPLVLGADEGWEYAVMAVDGDVSFQGSTISAGSVGALEPGADTLRIAADGADAGDVHRAILIGGQPFTDELVMWWNFIGRSHEEVEEFRANWQAALGDGDGDASQFEIAPRTDDEPELHAPELPSVRLRSRNRRAQSS